MSNLGVSLTNRSAADRHDGDFYATPPEATQALLDFAGFIPNCVWEPACGDDAIVKVIQASGRKVVGTDLAQGVDFLETESLRAPWIVTNPPFNLAAKFIEHCAALGADGFALLLKSQYWHASKRLNLFERVSPSYILPLTWRPDFHFGSKGGSPTMDVLWTVWEKPYKNSPVYMPLRRPKGR